MAQFLSDEWLSDLAAAASRVTVAPDLQLVIAQIVSDGPSGEVAYGIEIGDGRVQVRAGRVESADITLTQDRATAVSIARGEISAQAAFMAGRLRVGGDLRAAMTRTRELAALDDVFADARPGTTW